MLKLAVLADDFTGALDTGVQFSKAGISTCVLLSEAACSKISDISAQVAVFDLESRHDTAEAAYKKVYETACALFDAGIKHIYKKTDSALRGNIGAELTALLDASKGNLLEFIPAFPKNGRTTKNGIHYISQIEVAKSVFGNDPFNPVKHSYIPDIIAEQSNAAVSLGKTLTIPHIRLHDAQSEEDLRQIAHNLSSDVAIAGCAAFAEYLPDILGIKGDIQEAVHNLKKKNLLLLSGSVNEITLRQLEEAKKKRTLFYVESNEQDIADEFAQNGVAIVTTADILHKPDFSKLSDAEIEQNRRLVSQKMAKVAHNLFEKLLPDAVAVFGGDTLIAIIRELDCREIVPISEITSGTVLCRAKTAEREFLLVTKSGGFGDIDTVQKIEEFLK